MADWLDGWMDAVYLCSVFFFMGRFLDYTYIDLTIAPRLKSVFLVLRISISNVR